MNTLRSLPTAFLLLLATTVAPAAAQSPRPTRRQEVTPELDRSAFADADARLILARARSFRIAQDTALRAYDAKSFLRFTIGMGVRRIGADKLLLRTEQSARVRWAREAGVWVEPTGRRTAFPMGSAQLDLADAAPIPYFPGRESLWIPSGDMRVVQAEVNELDMLHPLAIGAEAYYRYSTGDSLTIRLPDGRAIRLRELRISARRPDWRAFVGSFWFDVDRGGLVRAAYRMAADLDVWQMASDEQKAKLRELEQRVRSDTGVLAERARVELKRERGTFLEALGKKLVAGTMTPLRAKLTAVTVEFGLYEGRFWLPKLNVAEGELIGGFLRAPLKWQESFRYESVNGTEAVPVVPLPGQMGLAADDTLRGTTGFVTIGDNRRPPADTSAAARVAREDSLVKTYNLRVDTLRTAAEVARLKGDTASERRLLARAARRSAMSRQIIRRRAGCTSDSTYFAGTVSRYKGALRTAIRLPCDLTRLDNSPDLPGSIYDEGEELFGASERDELLKSLDFSLQAGWGPKPPVLHTGLDLLRFNRIEGLSLGGSVTSELGLGFVAQAIARFGIGDRVLNGELSLARGNGREEMKLGIFHRLGVANDDWGAPLSFGASVSNLLNARDEGFYYRTWGAELAGTREAPASFGAASLRWRLFAERQRSAGVEPNTQASLRNVIGSARFGQNIAAAPLTAVGAGGELVRGFGMNPIDARADVRVRVEGALTDRADSLGTSGYGRVALDATIARLVRGFPVSVSGAVGTSAGDLPPQRAFYVGGLQTVRGQFAAPDGAGRVGNAFWLVRTELGLGEQRALRPSLFYDAGWAGQRSELARSGRPLSGAGVGLSLLDGLVRTDVSRGIWPEQRWRWDVYLGSRF